MGRAPALACIAAVAGLALATGATAGEALKAAIGQRGNWDSAVVHLGTKAGIFQKHGLEVEAIYTSGSGETLQPAIAGSVDIGIAVGTLGAIAAYAKGAPIRIVGAQATGDAVCIVTLPVENCSFPQAGA
jgi:NitT/TauT family transport system substrate-binding protein